MGVPIGYQEYFVQTKTGQLRYMKLHLEGEGWIRPSSDRLGSYTSMSKQDYSEIRIQVVEDMKLDDYQAELVRQINHWQDSHNAYGWPREAPLEEVDIIFDLLFFWRNLAYSTTSKVVTSSGFLLWDIATASFGGIKGAAVDALLDAAFKPILKSLLRIVNIEAEWVLEVATGVATKFTSDAGEEFFSQKSGQVWPPNQYVGKLNAVLAFRRMIDAKSLNAFQFKFYPGQGLPLAPAK